MPGAEVPYPIAGAANASLIGSAAFAIANLANSNTYSAAGISTLFPEIPGLTTNLEGLPKGQKTQRAVEALFASRVPALQLLAHQIKQIHDAGGTLSTGDPALRRDLGTFVHRAVVSLENQGISRTKAFNQISNALSYGTVPRFNIPQPTKSDLTSFVEKQVPRLPLYGAGLGAAYAFSQGGIEAVPLGALEGYELGAQARDLIQKGIKIGRQVQSGLDAFTNLLHPQPMPTEPGPVFTPQGRQPSQFIPPMVGQGGGEPGPLIPPGPQVPELQDCPECGYLAHQRGELKDEIKIEQQQQLQQQYMQQQQQIEHFHELESQDISTRDVSQELRQKQQLLNQINQEISQLQQQSGGEQSSSSSSSSTSTSSSSTGGAPTLDYQPAQVEVTQQESDSQLFEQKTATQNPHPLDSQAVRFCVQCTSQAESLKFLNGEPSECSIVI